MKKSMVAKEYTWLCINDCRRVYSKGTLKRKVEAVVWMFLYMTYGFLLWLRFK